MSSSPSFLGQEISSIQFFKITSIFKQCNFLE